MSTATGTANNFPINLKLGIVFASQMKEKVLLEIFKRQS
jgi:hypothetical protein